MESSDYVIPAFPNAIVCFKCFYNDREGENSVQNQNVEK